MYYLFPRQKIQSIHFELKIKTILKSYFSFGGAIQIDIDLHVQDFEIILHFFETRPCDRISYVSLSVRRSVS